MDPVRLVASVPQALAFLARLASRRHLHHGRLRRHPGAEPRPRSCASRRCCGRATWRPVGACGPPPGWQRPHGQLPGDRHDALARRAYVTGTPIRHLRARGRAAREVGCGLQADVPVLLVFGGSQAVRRFNRAVAEALPAGHTRSVIHMTGDTALRGGAQGARAAADRLRARYRPFPFLREEMADALVAADLLVGRAGSSTLAEAAPSGCPCSSCPIPMPPLTRRRTREGWSQAGAARAGRRRGFDAGPLIEAACDCRRPGAWRRCAPRAGRWAGRVPPRATGELLLALGERRHCRPPTRRATARGRTRDQA